jgi:hypothetical protein
VLRAAGCRCCLLSPQAKQEPNEFIVLNASAYHAGYNMGFNCAEVRETATVCCSHVLACPLQGHRAACGCVAALHAVCQELCC